MQIEALSQDNANLLLNASGSSLSGFFVEIQSGDLIYGDIDKGYAQVTYINKADQDGSLVQPLDQFLLASYLLDIDGSIWIAKDDVRKNKEGEFSVTGISIVDRFSDITEPKKVVTGIFDKSLGYRNILLSQFIKDYDCISYSKCQRYDAGVAYDTGTAKVGEQPKSTTPADQDSRSVIAMGVADVIELVGSKTCNKNGDRAARIALKLFNLELTGTVFINNGLLDINFNTSYNRKGSEK